MKWEAVDATYPWQALPTRVSSWSHEWVELRRCVDALLTHFARASVGYHAGELDRDAAKNAVTWARAQAFMVFGFGAGGTKQESEYGKGVCALLAAALGDAELVVSCTGGKALPSKVSPAKTFAGADGDDLRKLARHLATAARAKLPPSHVVATLRPLRDGFVDGTLRDPRLALVAIYTLLTHVATLPAAELASTCRDWLEGKPLDFVEGTAVVGVADGQDPRATIFEQFSASLANPVEATIYRDDLLLSPADHTTSDPSLFSPKLASHAATYLYLARHPLPAGWALRVDPHVARWLGGEVDDDAIEARRRQQLSDHQTNQAPRTLRHNLRTKQALVPAISALHLGDPDALAAYTGGGKLAPFKPWKHFKDDWRKLLRYLGAAVATRQAAPSDVEPAWFDFLSRKRTEWWSWTHLLAIQAVITVQLGHRDPTTVGRALQVVLTGI